MNGIAKAGLVIGGLWVVAAIVATIESTTRTRESRPSPRPPQRSEASRVRADAALAARLMGEFSDCSYRAASIANSQPNTPQGINNALAAGCACKDEYDRALRVGERVERSAYSTPGVRAAMNNLREKSAILRMCR